jgi:ribose 5-phosphate isomerase B
MKTIAVASDHGGFALKEKIKTYLVKKGLRVKDLGTYSPLSCDYPDYSYSLAALISTGKYKKGILICKSGIGNAIVANRAPGVRAALCYNLKAVRLSRQHNDSNVLVLGSLFVKEGMAKKMVDVWLKTQFESGRHQRRLNKIRDIERKLRIKR